MKVELTWRDEFLARLVSVVPWMRWQLLIEMHDFQIGPKGGSPPMPLKTMKCI
jgi:IS5 family transposase